MARRTAIPSKVASEVLLADRHSCCICQKSRVHLHHIDGDPNNNKPSNIAALCLDHHDQATMQHGLTRKLQPGEVRRYKLQWEAKCESDILALSREHVLFYATAYKNPPRIRELFLKLSADQRSKAATVLLKEIASEEEVRRLDQGFKWQALPRKDETTLACISSMQVGELWPSWLPRVRGHPKDHDYPVDMSPPEGMRAFHLFDVYCHILTRALLVSNEAQLLEQIIMLREVDAIDSLAGSLVTFRQRAYGKGISIPGMSEEKPTGRLQFRVRWAGKIYRTLMIIKNMYVFSDSSADYLHHCRVSGVGLLGGASEEKGSREIHIQVTPLLIGIGGFTGHNPDGWWNLRKQKALSGHLVS